MRWSYLFFILLFSLVLVACGSQTEPESKKNFDDYRIANTELLENLSEAPQGTGRLLFTAPLQSFDSKEHYIIEFRLLEEGSSLRLFSHFSSFQKADGFEVAFVRAQEEIAISFSTPGRPAKDLGRLALPSQSTPLKLRIEVHNGVAQGVRCLVWQDKISYDGLTWTKLDKVTEANASLDTQSLNSLFLSKGLGVFWGVELHRAELTQAKREAPYVD